MYLFKKKIERKVLVLRLEENKTFDLPDFNVESFLESLSVPKTHSKVSEPVQKIAKEDGDVLDAVPPNLFDLKDNEQKSCPAKFLDGSFFDHQRIVSDYLNINTPYRGLLLYHGLGSGKACTSVAVAEGAKAEIVHVLSPRGQNFKDQIVECGVDLDKYRFSPFAMESSVNPFHDSVVVLDEVHRFNVDDPKVRRVYEWIREADCRVVALSSFPVAHDPKQLGVIFNMVRGNVKTFTVKGDWTAVADSVLTHKDTKDGSLLVRTPLGYVNVMEEGKRIGVRRTETPMSDAEFAEKVNAVVQSVKPLPDDDTFLKLSEEGFKKRIAGLVAYFPDRSSLFPKLNPSVCHVGEVNALLLEQLAKGRHLVYSEKFPSLIEFLKENGYVELVLEKGKVAGNPSSPRFIHYKPDMQGETMRRLFNSPKKIKINVFIVSTPDDVEVHATDTHMVGILHFDEIVGCARRVCGKTVVTPHVYLPSTETLLLHEDAMMKRPEIADVLRKKEEGEKWLACMKEVSIDCSMHGMRCYSKHETQHNQLRG